MVALGTAAGEWTKKMVFQWCISNHLYGWIIVSWLGWVCKRQDESAFKHFHLWCGFFLPREVIIPDKRGRCLRRRIMETYWPSQIFTYNLFDNKAQPRPLCCVLQAPCLSKLHTNYKNTQTSNRSVTEGARKNVWCTKSTDFTWAKLISWHRKASSSDIAGLVWTCAVLIMLQSLPRFPEISWTCCDFVCLVRLSVAIRWRVGWNCFVPEMIVLGAMNILTEAINRFL